MEAPVHTSTGVGGVCVYVGNDACRRTRFYLESQEEEKEERQCEER